MDIERSLSITYIATVCMMCDVQVLTIVDDWKQGFLVQYAWIGVSERTCVHHDSELMLLKNAQSIPYLLCSIQCISSHSSSFHKPEFI
jgi:hypothetical protein